MQRAFVTLPMLLPRMSDRAAAQQHAASLRSPGAALA